MTPKDPTSERVDDRHGATVAALPTLRAFARALIRDRASADDLVRRAITRGLAPGRQAPPAIGPTVWLLAILHELHQDDEVPDGASPVTAPHIAGDDTVPGEFGPLRQAFWQLRDDERKALVLTVATGLSSAEAAFVCGCTASTIGVRAMQGRHTLGRALRTPAGTDAPELARV